MRAFASALQLLGVALVALALWFVDWRLSVGLLGGGMSAVGFATERRQDYREAVVRSDG